jgi:mannose-6-phosphate isomerase-like protein (cupin superfamily)
MTEQRSTATALWVLGHRVTPFRVGGRIAALEIATPPGVPGPPPHHHEDCAEGFLVVSGRLGVMIDGAWTTLGPGDQAEVPQGTVHTFRNEGDEEVRAMTAFDPAGFEAFFYEFGIDAADPGAFEASVSEDSIGRVVEGCARFGMILTAR